MLYAEWPKKIPGAKTVLYYMHLDGQPVVNREWSQPDPFVPVVKKRNPQGKWEIVETNLLFTDNLDPDLRVFARSASDDIRPYLRRRARTAPIVRSCAKNAPGSNCLGAKREGRWPRKENRRGAQHAAGPGHQGIRHRHRYQPEACPKRRRSP